MRVGHVPFRVLVAVASVALAVPVSAGCKKSLIMREVPGGEPQRAQLVECDETETPALLEGNAHFTLCSHGVLAQVGGSFEDCARAVDAAREGLRKAKIRAALRAGTDKQLIEERFTASGEEIEAQRASAELSGPIPTEARTPDGAAQ